ncbi:MAG: flagellar motor switch protein FliN [Deltaproteobacteria bacterium]|nr:flagellar motor switch protein FliN [Deltaproteobacteria bacterium]
MAKDDKSVGTSDLNAADETSEGIKKQGVPETSTDDTSIKNLADIPSDSEGDQKEKPYAFSDLDKSTGPESPDNIDFILDIPLEISVELGRSKMLINDLLRLGQGSVIGLTKLAGETLEVLANQRLIARGEVVVVDEKYGIRLTEIVSPTERIERLK